MNPIQIALCFSGFLFGGLSWSAETVKGTDGNTISAPTRRRVEVHLYGADMRAGAPLAKWYHEIGITDAWLPYAKGAFPQDTANDGYAPDAPSVETLTANGTLAAYRENKIRYWWFERPVPDFLYQISKRPDFPKSNLWDDSAESDALWARICEKIASIYPQVRQAGFSGLVYDTEAYYSFQGDETGTKKPWIWGGHDAQYGQAGNYYKRGLQVGRAIHAAWPKAPVILAYAFGYTGEAWWYRGIMDGGVTLILGPEHSYGAGPGDFGRDYFQTWWEGRTTKQTCDWKRTQFPFIPDNQHVNAGLFPIDFGAKKQNYRAQYFRQQLASAANDDPAGPIPVWIWPQGPFTPQGFQDVKYVDGDNAKDYFDALRDYSQAFTAAPDRPKETIPSHAAMVSTGSSIGADTKNIALAVPFAPGGRRPERVMTANAFVDPSGKAASRDITMACWYNREKLHLDLEAKTGLAKAGAPGPRDTNAWNGFELFIKPPNSGEFYYHLAIDANGTLYDAKVSENLGVIKGMDTKWDMTGGTVSSRLENGRHRVTLAIPFASLRIPAPAPGDGWRFNACYGGKQWSPTYSWNHVPKQFGYLFFADDDPVVERFAISPLAEDSGTVSLATFAAQPSTVTLKIMAIAKREGKSFPFTIPLSLEKGENRFTAPLRIPEAGAYVLSVQLVNENQRLLYAATNLPRPIMPFKRTQHALVSALDDAIQRLARGQQKLDDVRQAQAKIRQSRTWDELYSGTAPAVYWINLSRCPGGLGYARASSGQKIYPTDLLPATDFAQPIDLCAAGGEIRGAQVVVFSASGMNDVEIQVAPLDETAPPLDHEAIKVGAVKYLATQPPVYAANPGFLHPDPIEPITTACTLTSDVPNLFYITVNIKSGHAAGLYANKLRFTRHGKALFSVPLRTRVFGFSLPETPSLASSIWFFRDHIRKLYKLDRPFSYEDAAPYFRFFAKYRLSLMDYPETRDDSTLPYAAVILRQDTAGNLKVAPDLINGLLSRHPYMNINFLSVASCQMPDGRERALTADDPKHAAKLVDDYLRNENLTNRFYSLIGDEPTASSYTQVLEAGRASKQRFPSVPRVSTTHPVPELAEVVDVWCPLPRSFTPAERQHELDAGKAFWLYTAVYSDPPYPNHYLDTAAIYPRMLFWVSYKYAVTGYLNWGANYWTGFQRELNRNVIKDGTLDYPTWQTSIIGNLGAANGDGYLCYPNPASAYAEPFSCLRLENMRDGLQDYEYLKMAEQLTAKNGDTTVKKWLKLPFIKAPGEFPLDGHEIEALRIGLGEFIESSVQSNKKTTQVAP